MKKSYYAIIPANVRYDEKLKANSKLLYGEITALCNEKGYCWASNSYFAELYNVSKETISRWISELADKGYIQIELIYKEGTKQIINRYIRINHEPIDENINTPIDEKVKGNNTDYNTTSNIYDYWNEKGIIKHRKLHQKTRSSINARLEEYSVEELKKAIDNYAEVLKNDEYYWTYKWTLQDFMKPDNVVKFMDEANPLKNYRKGKPKQSIQIGGDSDNLFQSDNVEITEDDFL